MVADLVYDRADLAVTPLDVTEERMHYIDYLLSIGFSRLVLLSAMSFLKLSLIV